MAAKSNSKLAATEAMRALKAQRAEELAAQAGPSAPARRRADTIRDGLRAWSATRAAIVEAFALDDWVTLGYSSWQDYCDTEFSMEKLRLSADELRDAAAAFKSAGMNLREIGAATGTSAATAQRALKAGSVSDETKPPLVSAVRAAIEDASIGKDSFRCEKCDRFLPEGVVRAAQTRCVPCDPNRDHFATEEGGPCLACPTEPAGTGLGGEPADVDQAATSAGTPTGPTSPGPVGDLPDSPAADSLSDSSSHAGVPAVGGKNEERIEVMSAEEFEAAVNRQLDALQLTREQLAAMAVDDEWVSLAAKKLWLAIKDSPAAPLDTLPVGAPPASEQPGQDSPPVADHPVATPGPAEIDHHQVSGVSPGGVPPEMPSVMAEELGDGGGTSLTPPSSSSHPPDRLMYLTAKFSLDLVKFDAEALGPLIDEDDVPTLLRQADDFADFVRRLIKARTP